MRALIAGGGFAVLAATLTLAISRAPLGTPVFLAAAGVMSAVYVAVLRRVLAPDPPPTRGLVLALLFAVAFRVPLALAPVDGRSDMIRYLYDGRVQRLGLNPYAIVPSTPSLAWTHTAVTRTMTSVHDRTPYPAAAQWFFRAVVTVHESRLAMKLALLACDLLTILVLLRWLAACGRSPWLAVAYAWNPLVILEIAHSGHIDALGVLWIAVAAWMLSTRRTLLASAALVIAIATKLLPIVLLPLFWRRVRVRDALAGGAVLAALYLPFSSAGVLPLAGVSSLIDRARFNGPVFRTLAALAGPRAAVAAAILAGLAAAAWMRRRRAAEDPAAWAWPMAIALAGAPVIYPWYLLYCTPFLFTLETLPIAVWTIGIIPTYLVWHLPDYRRLWAVPPAALALEYGAVLAAVVWMWRRLRAGSRKESLR
ncbi:MAG TPA: hypothetical protein VFX12_07070 [Vicinamibacterales bacterium]|nr:hypothetical protein [Vicinamibacterales bacterium]